MDSPSDTIVAIQAAAAAVSACTALGLGWLTISRQRESRAERERDRAHEQLRRIVDALQELPETFGSSGVGFDVARTKLSASLAMRPVELPAVVRLVATDMPRPPYGMGQVEPFERLEAAINEVRRYARSLG